MNVNQKGVKGLIKVIDDLCSRGWYTFPAFDDHSPVDLVAMSPQGKVVRLQVKYRSRMANRGEGINRYELPTKSVVDRKVVNIDRTLIDGWAVYMAEDDRVVYIHKSHLTDTQRMLCVDPDKDYGELAEWSIAIPC